uniref:Uncharacterized protein n=1 Tax=Anopheles maculatus TaxID=74869 RepID=A0A182SRV4_9DIPT
MLPKPPGPTNVTHRSRSMAMANRPAVTQKDRSRANRAPVHRKCIPHRPVNILASCTEMAVAVAVAVVVVVVVVRAVVVAISDVAVSEVMVAVVVVVVAATVEAKGSIKLCAVYGLQRKGRDCVEYVIF